MTNDCAVSLRLPTEVRAKLAERAASNDTSISFEIRAAIERDLEDWQEFKAGRPENRDPRSVYEVDVTPEWVGEVGPGARRLRMRLGELMRVGALHMVQHHMPALCSSCGGTKEQPFVDCPRSFHGAPAGVTTSYATADSTSMMMPRGWRRPWQGQETSAVSLPSWLASSATSTGCKHDFSIQREVPAVEPPPYVKPPVYETYCAGCGTKASLRDMLALAQTEPSVRREQAPPPLRRPPAVSLPEPIPEDEIHIEFDIERFGRRYDNDRRKGLKDMAVNVGDARWTDAMAGAAETYVAMALGLPTRENVTKPDPGWDMVLFGRRIQVKWTRHDDGQLIASPKQRHVADYFVLVTGATTAEFKIRGYARLRELLASTTDLGFGPTHTVDQEELHPFSDPLEMRLQGATESKL